MNWNSAGRVAVLMAAMSVVARAEPDISNWVKDLGSDDAAKRDQAQDAILDASMPALPQVEKALEGDKDVERVVRLKAIRERLQGESHLLAQPDLWFRNGKKTAYRRMQTELGERDGHKAWHLTDTFVEKSKDGTGTQAWEAWTEHTGAMSPIFLRWTAHGLMEGLKIELDVEFRFGKGLMKIKTVKLECDNADVKKDFAGLYNRELKFDATLVWFHSIPRLAVILPNGAGEPLGARRLQLPEDLPFKGLAWTWGEPATVTVDGKPVHVRTFDGNTVDDDGRLLRISEDGTWDRVAETAARAGVDDGK